MLRAGVESKPDGEEGWGWWGGPHGPDPLRSKAAGKHSPMASLYFFSVSLSLLQNKLHRQWAFPIASQCLLRVGFTYHVKKWEWESPGPLSEESQNLWVMKRFPSCCVGFTPNLTLTFKWKIKISLSSLFLLLKKRGEDCSNQKEE